MELKAEEGRLTLSSCPCLQCPFEQCGENPALDCLVASFHFFSGLQPADCLNDRLTCPCLPGIGFFLVMLQPVILDYLSIWSHCSRSTPNVLLTFPNFVYDPIAIHEL